ncbi:34428_t:CDS:2, partial [Racocetra persica]
MTDIDIKERKLLAKIWPEIILLLCFFHISQCCKNEINKQLGHGGNNKIILLRKTVKIFLKKLLESIQKAETILKNKKILEGSLKFFTYLIKQWASDLLCSWCLNGRMKAAEVLGIPLKKLPTTNNHFEKMNEYLKNNQLNQERRKELNIMNPSDCKILMQEFLQVAYLSPSTKRDESAKKLLEMKKVIKYEVEEISGKIYVEVESETTPGFPTDICCQCFDFLQTGIIYKHLRAAALYLNKLRKQEPYKYLPKMIFLTYQEAQNIYHSQYDNKSEVLVGSENEDDIKHILGINSSSVMSSSDVPIANVPRLNKINFDTLNITAIYKQEFKEFLESTLR